MAPPLLTKAVEGVLPRHIAPGTASATAPAAAMWVKNWFAKGMQALCIRAPSTSPVLTRSRQRTLPKALGGGGLAIRRVIEGNGRQWLPDDGQVRVADGGKRVGVGNQGADWLTTMVDVGFGEDGPVLVGRVDAVKVAARNIGGGQDFYQSKMADEERAEIADCKARMKVRAADRSECKWGFVRKHVGAETVSAG
jgi:hypothetical protein